MPFQNYTRATLRTMLQNRLQNPNFWQAPGNDEQNRYLNEAIREWQVCTGYWKARASINTVGQRVIYDQNVSLLDANNNRIFSAILRISYNGVPLDQSNVLDMDNGFPGWQLQSTGFSGYGLGPYGIGVYQANGVGNLTAPLVWGPMGFSYFFIWPADAVGNNGLQIDGIQRAPILTSDTQYLNAESSVVTAILDYAEHISEFKRQGIAFPQSMTLLKRFFSAAAEYNSHLRATAIYRRYMGEDAAQRRRARYASQNTGRKATVGVR